MTGHGHPAPDAEFWPLALMWFGMMAMMMAPTAWPWVRAFHRFSDAGGSPEVAGTARFAAGYLLAWCGYAAGAAVMQRALQGTTLMAASGDAVVPWMGAVIFLIAGLYQFAPLKRACLTHCRTPLGYFLTRWRNGPMGAFHMGLHHGLFCVGCCWALMATAFAVGTMNPWWMGALGVLALGEQIAPHGRMLRRGLGAVFLAAGIFALGVLVNQSLTARSAGSRARPGTAPSPQPASDVTKRWNPNHTI
jgi:predicted metal-binding membrane protein